MDRASVYYFVKYVHIALVKYVKVSKKLIERTGMLVLTFLHCSKYSILYTESLSTLPALSSLQTHATPKSEL